MTVRLFPCPSGHRFSGIPAAFQAQAHGRQAQAPGWILALPTVDGLGA